MKMSEKSKKKNYNNNFIKIKILVCFKDQTHQLKYQLKKIHKILVKKQHFKIDTQIHFLKTKITKNNSDKNNKESTEELWSNKRKLKKKERKQKNKR